MNRLVCLLAILGFFVRSRECADLEPQIKVTKHEHHYHNPNYIRHDTFELEVTPHNATYNNLRLYWDILQDLPANISVVVKVYLADKNGKKQRLIYTDDIPVCTENKNRELLMTSMVVPKSQLGGKCVKKGSQFWEDMGQVRYEHLIPNIEELGKYYAAYYALVHGQEVIIDATFYSHWGYLED